MRFRYTAFDSRGKRLAGELAAESEAEILRALRGQGITVVEVVRAAAAAGAKPKRQQPDAVLRQLGLMLRSGVALADGLSVMQEEEFDPVLDQIERLVRAGMPVSGALREARFDVPAYVPALIAASEASGQLGDGLVEAAELLKRIRDMRREFLTQLIYPAILIVSGLVAVFLLFTFVVPKFAGMLQSSKAELPWISVLVLRAGRFFSEHIVLIGACAAMLAAFIGAIVTDERRRVKALNGLTRVPGVAPLVARFDTTRWLRVMANLVAGRLRLLRSLEVAQEALVTDMARNSMERVIRRVRSGEALSGALGETGLLSRQQIMIVRSGERAGALASALDQLAADEEVSLRTNLKRLVLLLEPVCILGIGASIGILMVGIMLAVTSLSNVAL